MESQLGWLNLRHVATLRHQLSHIR